MLLPRKFIDMRSHPIFLVGHTHEFILSSVAAQSLFIAILAFGWFVVVLSV